MPFNGGLISLNPQQAWGTTLKISFLSALSLRLAPKERSGLGKFKPRIEIGE